MHLQKILLGVFLALLLQLNVNNQAALLMMQRKKPRRRWWVRPVNKKKDEQGFYSNLIREIYDSDHEEFFDLFRMWPEQFRVLSQLVEPFLRKRSIRTPLPTVLRLAVTLT
jgi:hypothetical protein